MTCQPQLENPYKYSDSRLDYLFEFAALRNNLGESDWLREGEIIILTDIVIEPKEDPENPEDLICSNFSIINSGLSVLAWLEKGIKGKSYEVFCKYETNQGRKDTKKITIIIV